MTVTFFSGVFFLSKALVIVESPAKAKTIEEFLGKRHYRVLASVGHVRDLPKSQLGVDVDDGFKPKYITIRGKGPVVQQLRESAKKAKKVLLATDPDREGEAISWHIAQLIGIENEPCRITFNEITKEAVIAAAKNPRLIDKDLVDAQQARRVLDRLVGYKLSPLLWRKIRRGLSAGRVQSVAVRLICDREQEIEQFQEREYWTLAAELATEEQAILRARYVGGEGKGKDELPDEQVAQAIIEACANAQFLVKRVTRKERKRNPAPPFTTSSLQQEAARKLGFTVKRTMRVAQQLYEGLPIRGEGNVGLITYIRTDSVRISNQAAQEANDYIKERWGERYSTTRRGKAKDAAQDAHEAIRPTSVARSPESLKNDLNRDQLRLYRLIWERFVASQMSAAVLDTVAYDIVCADHPFRANGSTVKFDGFMLVYTEGRDEEQPMKEDGILPDLEEGQSLQLNNWKPEQHFTQPPARYNEAMLVRTLEELGIGRPSTYAPIIETIQQRGYIERVEKRFRPTELGRVVTQLLMEHFPNIVDVQFTAQLESELDKIEEGQREWQEVISNFYEPFAEMLKAAEESIGHLEIAEEETDEICELCGRRMVIKQGRFGRFIACPGFPECRNTKPLLEKVGVSCPSCGGEIVQRKSRNRRVFYGCSNYPDCSFTLWNRPLPKKCPQCGSIMVEKGSKKRGLQEACSNEQCGYSRTKSDE